MTTHEKQKAQQQRDKKAGKARQKQIRRAMAEDWKESLQSSGGTVAKRLAALVPAVTGGKQAAKKKRNAKKKEAARKAARRAARKAARKALGKANGKYMRKAARRARQALWMITHPEACARLG